MARITFLVFSLLNLSFILSKETCEDIVSKYVVYTPQTPPQAQSIKFRSFIFEDIDLWFDDISGEGVYQGFLKFGQETTITSYPGHVFYCTFSNKNDHRILYEVEVSEDKILYLISMEYGPSELSSNQRQLVNEQIEKSEKELKFMEEYFQKNGRHWLHHFDRDNGKPRNPPILHMWSELKIGLYYTVESNNLYWNCEDVKNISCRSNNFLSIPQPTDLSYYSQISSFFHFTPQPKLSFRLISISNSPRAFLIENFLSSFEVNEIIRLALPNITESVVGQSDGGGIMKSLTRTSSNTWIQRNTSPLIETIFQRVADILGVNHTILTSKLNAEDIQVVHYGPQEEYQSHYDWGVRGYPESRFVTILLYLSDRLDENSGGETSFPKGEESTHPGGFKIIPKKGMAVMFYNLLEDGNGDKYSLHAALPIIRGEKWLANLWIWDPLLPKSIRMNK